MATQYDPRPGVAAEQAYNSVRDRVAKETWLGIAEAAAGGFGKGLLCVAIGLIAATALVFGTAAATFGIKEFMHLGGNLFQETGLVEVGRALSGGAQFGAGMLFHPVGLAAMAAGGAAGFCWCALGEKKNLEEARAVAAARAADKDRELARMQALQPTQDITKDPMYDADIDSRAAYYSPPERQGTTFVDAEKARCAANKAKGLEERAYG